MLLTLLFFTPLLLSPAQTGARCDHHDGGAQPDRFHEHRATPGARSRDDGIAAVVTFVATLAFAPNIQNGILTGIMLSLALLLYRMMRPRVAVLGMHRGRHAARCRYATACPRCIRSSARSASTARCFFVNVSYFEEAILKLERDNPDVKHILVKGSGINDIDASGVEMLPNLITRFRSNGITLGFSGFKKQRQEVMDRTGLIDKIGRENIFPTDREALEYLNRVLA